MTLGHQASLEQVLVNLLLNAADALRGRPPGAPRHIRIAAEVGPTDGMLRLTVADSGGGIPEAILPRLFELLVSTKDDAALGTGLGLSICHGRRDRRAERSGWRGIQRRVAAGDGRRADLNLTTRYTQATGQDFRGGIWRCAPPVR